MTRLEKPHLECVKCKWNKFPWCLAQKIDNEYMRNDYLRPTFKCGRQNLDEVDDTTYFKVDNPHDITVKEKIYIAALEERIQELEEKTSELSAEPISR